VFAEWICGVDFPVRWEPIRREAILPARAAPDVVKAPAVAGPPQRSQVKALRIGPDDPSVTETH